MRIDVGECFLDFSYRYFYCSRDGLKFEIKKKVSEVLIVEISYNRPIISTMS